MHSFTRSRFATRYLALTLLVAACPRSVDAGLVAHWRFDGDLLDSGVNDHETTFTEGEEPRFEVGHDGLANGALQLDGIAEFGEVTSSTTLPVSTNAEYSVAFWIKGSPQPGRTIFSEAGDSSGDGHLVIGTRLAGETGEIRVEIDRGGGDIVLAAHSDGMALDGTWHHVAWVDRGGEGALYIDGIRDPTEFRRPRGSLAFTRSGFGATVGSSACCFFRGGLDELRLFDHALTEFEVQRLADNPAGCPDAGDTRCGNLEILPGPHLGLFLARSEDAVDDSGDEIRYTFLAESDAGDTVVIGPQPEPDADFLLDTGTWNFSVIVDDDPNCFDLHHTATCRAGPVLVGCPREGDTHCGTLIVTRPRDGGSGTFRFEVADAIDESGDTILYSLRAENREGRALELGPNESPRFDVELPDGEWMVTATVDDDLDCDDVADDATCTEHVTVGCPTEGDTICGDFLVEGPLDATPGRYTMRVEGSIDESGDTVFFTFRAERPGGAERGELFEVGPQRESHATFSLEEGSWILSATVDDDEGCADVHPDAKCVEELDVAAEEPREISHWRLDGDLFDAQPSLNHLIPFETPEIEFTTGFDGKPEGALRFALEDTCFEAQQRESLPLRLHRAHTIALWVQGPPQREGTVWAEASSTTDTPLFAISTDLDGKTGRANLLLRDGRGRTLIDRVDSFLEPFDGTWHHLACVVDGNSITLYVDGIRDPTEFPHQRPAIQLDRSSLGCRLSTQPQNFFRGAIDDVRVYNHALSQDEIAALIPEPNDCPESGDTHVESLEVSGPPGGIEGTYRLEARGASDESGDPLLFTFTATKDDGTILQSCPARAATAVFELSDGTWTLTVAVDDDLRCRDAADDHSRSVELLVGPAEQKLVAHLPFELHLDDVTGNGHDGIFTGEGEPDFVTSRDDTPFSALNLDARVDLSSTEDVPNHASGEFSIALWVRAGQQSQATLWSESASGTSAIFSIGPNSRASTGTVEVSLRTAEGLWLIPHRQSAIEAFDDTWHHVVWTESNGDAQLWIDGELDPTDFSYERGVVDFDTASLGGIASRDVCCGFRGTVDELRVYNYVLSEDEIAELAGVPIGPSFVRGDTNDDGNVDLADGVFVLNFLFTGGAMPSCMESANTNDDDTVDLTDGVFVLNFLFTGGAEPPPPSPSEGCGVESEDAESFGCEEFSSCP